MIELKENNYDNELIKLSITSQENIYNLSFIEQFIIIQMPLNCVKTKTYFIKTIQRPIIILTFST